MFAGGIHNNFENFRYLAPIWTLASTAMRIAFVTTLSSPKFSEHFREVYRGAASKLLRFLHGLRKERES